MNDADFPELTSFGTLFSFAVALEQAAAELATHAAALDLPTEMQRRLADRARQHEKRRRELERLRRERLNEVVLQPVTGMERADFLPALTLPTTPPAAIAAIADAEERLARFYDEAARAAGPVLTGMDRKLGRYAADSRAAAADLR